MSKKHFVRLVLVSFLAMGPVLAQASTAEVRKLSGSGGSLEGFDIPPPPSSPHPDDRSITHESIVVSEEKFVQTADGKALLEKRDALRKTAMDLMEKDRAIADGSPEKQAAREQANLAVEKANEAATLFQRGYESWSAKFIAEWEARKAADPLALDKEGNLAWESEEPLSESRKRALLDAVSSLAAQAGVRGVDSRPPMERMDDWKRKAKGLSELSEYGEEAIPSRRAQSGVRPHERRPSSEQMDDERRAAKGTGQGASAAKPAEVPNIAEKGQAAKRKGLFARLGWKKL